MPYKYHTAPVHYSSLLFPLSTFPLCFCFSYICCICTPHFLLSIALPPLPSFLLPFFILTSLPPSFTPSPSFPFSLPLLLPPSCPPSLFSLLHPYTSLPPSLPSFQLFADARESPLEKQISDSIVATKDKDTNLFSLVPSRVAMAPSSTSSCRSPVGAIAHPDSFSDFFRMLGQQGAVVHFDWAVSVM